MSGNDSGEETNQDSLSPVVLKQDPPGSQGTWGEPSKVQEPTSLQGEGRVVKAGKQTAFIVLAWRTMG